MSELGCALDGVAALDVDGMPTVVIGAHIKDLLTARNRLDGEIERAIGVFDAKGLGEADGCPSTTSWLRGHVRLAPADASARVKTARMLRRLPVTAAALAAGEISFDHARQIALLAADTDVETTRGVEDQLVFVARSFSPLELARVLRDVREGWAREGDGDGDRGRDEQSEMHRRRLSVAASFEGMFNVAGWLTGEQGATVKAALDALAKPLPGDARTHGQRFADALTELARQSLNGGQLPQAHGVRPHLFAVTTVHPAPSPATPNGESRNDGCGGAPGDHTHGRAEPSERPLVCFGSGYVPGGAVLPPSVVDRLSCDATITRVLVSPTGEVLDLGRSQRVVTPAQWKALLVRDGGCVIPGHDCPPAFTQAHHLTPWTHGGRTDLDGLALICTYGHQLIHERGFALTTSHGCWVWRRPDGTEVIGAARGHTNHGGLSALATAITNGPRGPCAA